MTRPDKWTAAYVALVVAAGLLFWFSLLGAWSQ